MIVLASGVGLIVLALAAGWLMAWVSFRLPKNEQPAKARRYWILPIACAAIAAIATAWSAHNHYGVLTAAFTALFGWQLLLIAIIDAENFWLPDVITLPLGLSGLAANILLEPPLGQGWMMSLFSAAFAFAGLWLIAFIYKLVRKQRGMGAGDPILLAAGCAWVGIINLTSVLLWASLSALAVIAYLRFRKHKVEMTSRIPFGTYLALGLWISWLF